MISKNIITINVQGQYRVLFPTFKEEHDKSPEGKIGVRCHSAFIAFFLRLFGKIADIKTSDGKIYRLNKNSYDKWRQRHQAHLGLPSDNGKLPTAEQIVEERKKIKDELKISKKSLLKAKEKIEESRQGAIKEIHDLDQRIADNEKTKIDCQEKQTNFKKSIQDLRKEIEGKETEYEKKHDFITTDFIKNNDVLSNFFKNAHPQKDKVRAFEESIEQLKKALDKRKKESQTNTDKLDETTKAIQKDTEEKNSRAATCKDLLREKIAAHNTCQKKINELKGKLNPNKQVDSEKGCLDPDAEASMLTPAVGQAEQAAPQSEPITPYHVFLSDVEQETHPELKNLMEIIFTTIGKDIVKEWNFFSDTKEFSLVLHSPGKVFIRPRQDDGTYNPKTPKGVVTILGDNPDNEICGKLDKEKNTIFFSKGFKNYCEFKAYGFSGKADSEVNSMAYDPASNETTTNVTAKARIPLVPPRPDTTITGMKVVQKTWKNGVVLATTHKQCSQEELEAFLAKKPQYE